MKLFRIYGRALATLGPERSLGVLLAIANVALAAAQFAEPVLFGRIVDTLASAQGAKVVPGWSSLLPQLALGSHSASSISGSACSSRSMPIACRIGGGSP